MSSKGKRTSAKRTYHRRYYLSLLIFCYYRCHRSRETHDKRHREIAVLIDSIRLIDEKDGISTPVSGMRKKARKSDDLSPFDVLRDCDDVSVWEEEWQDDISVGDPKDLERACTPNAKESKRAKKLQKAEKKMAKSQSRVKVISSEDIARIAEAIHLNTRRTLSTKPQSRQNSDDLVSIKTVTENIGLVSHTSDHNRIPIRKDHGDTKRAAKPKGGGGGSGGGRPQAPTRHSHSADETEIKAILERLNIHPTTPLAPSGCSSRDRKSLVTKLQDAIRTDLTIIENEDRDTMMREAGYFRYVNRRTYNAMVRNNQIWDWVSGWKLEEVDEGEDGEEMEGRDGVGERKEKVVEDYGEDFEFEDEDEDEDEGKGKELRLVVRGVEGEEELEKECGVQHQDMTAAKAGTNEERDAGVKPNIYCSTTVAAAARPESAPTPENWDDPHVDTTYAITDLPSESLYN